MNKDNILNKFILPEYINNSKRMNNTERKFLNAYDIANRLNKNKDYISQKLKNIRLGEKKAYLNVINGNRVDIFGCLFNPVNGKIYKYFNDFNIKCKPDNLTLKRYYFSSQKDNINGLNCGLIGKGWILEYETYCNYKSNYIEIFYYDGTKDTFYKENNKFINKNYNSLNYILVEDINKYEFILNKENILYTFNFDGRLKKISDFYNNNLEVRYINNSKLISEIISSFGMKLRFNYIDNKVSCVSDNINRVVKYYYKNDFLSMVEYQNGGKYKFFYDEKLNKLNCIIDANGNIEFSAEYDKYGKPVKMYDIENNYAEIVYSDKDKQTIINKSERKIVYRFNNNKLIEKAEDNDIGAFTYKYDNNNNLIMRLNTFGEKTTYEYDNFNRITSKKLSNGMEVKYFYDIKNHISKISLSNDYQKLLSYDKNGSLTEKKIKIDMGMYSVTKYSYDSLGRIIEKVLPNKSKIRYEYRNQFSLLPNIIIYPDGFKVIKEYDNVSRLVKIIKGREIEEYKYNNIDLKIQTIYGDGSNDFKLYDLMGNLKEIILPQENRNSKLYNLPVHKYRYAYNEKNILTRIVCPDGQIYIKENIYKDKIKEIRQIQKKNFAGRVIERKIPLNKDINNNILYKIEKYLYNKSLNILERKVSINYIYQNECPEKFYTLKYDYDNNNNISNIYYANISSIKLLYKEKNKLHKIVAKVNDKYEYKVLYEYNNKGLLYKLIELLKYEDTDLDNYTTENVSYIKLETIFEYNANGSLILIKLPNNSTLKIDYDLNGNMVAAPDNWFLKQSCENELSIYKSYAIEQSFNNKYVFVYDIGGRITEIYNKVDNKLLYSYSYDCLNNILSIKDENGVTKFIYDKFLNIIKIIYPDNKYEIFEYDYMGNVSKYINKNGFIINYEFNSINKLKSISTDKYKITYKYNSYGNISNKEKKEVQM